MMSDLKTILLPNSITSVHEDAFEQTDTVTTINFTGTETEWQSIYNQVS